MADFVSDHEIELKSKKFDLRKIFSPGKALGFCNSFVGHFRAINVRKGPEMIRGS